MSTEGKIYPAEKDCQISKGLTRNFLDSMIGKTINVVPITWNNQKRILYVAISSDCIFAIPEKEISIYELSKSSEYPKEIRHILRNGVISVKICKNDSEIYLSRRENMLDAVEYFTNNIGNIVECSFLGSTQKLLFFELGAGITGTVYVTEISNSYVDNAKHYFIAPKKGEIMNLKIIGTKLNDDMHFDLSYKRALAPPIIQEGDLVFGKICGFLSSDNHSGLFVEVHPLISGIFNTDYVDVFSTRSEAFSAERHNNIYVLIGSHYYFRVKKITPKGLKLALYLF